MTQGAIRSVANSVFRHLHGMDLGFHLSRQVRGSYQEAAVCVSWAWSCVVWGLPVGMFPLEGQPPHWLLPPGEAVAGPTSAAGSSAHACCLLRCGGRRLQTGAVSRAIDRGTRGINFILRCGACALSRARKRPLGMLLLRPRLPPHCQAAWRMRCQEHPLPLLPSFWSCPAVSCSPSC